MSLSAESTHRRNRKTVLSNSVDPDFDRHRALLRDANLE
jgi:hypothetical protein